MELRNLNNFSARQYPVSEFRQESSSAAHIGVRNAPRPVPASFLGSGTEVQSLSALSQNQSSVSNVKRPEVSLSDVLLNYLAQVPAEESKQAIGYPQLSYGSTAIDSSGLQITPSKHDFIVASIPLGKEVLQLRKAGLANMFSEPWQQAVSVASKLNGGLGNTMEGFLAFSNDNGFVRLRNPRLSPEQNRRLALISLQTGVGVEDLPSRITDSALSDPKVSNWVDEVIGKFEQALENFAVNPAKGFKVKDGWFRHEMKLLPENGAVVSYSYRKHGGFRGFVESNLKGFMNILDTYSGVKFLKKIPVIGKPLAGIADLFSPLDHLKTAALSVAKGKVNWRNVLGRELAKVGTVLGAVASGGGSLLTSALAAASNLGSEWLLKGKLKAKSLVSQFTNMVPWFRSTKPEAVISKTVLTAGAEYLDEGKFSAETVAKGLEPLYDDLTGIQEVDDFIESTVGSAAKAIDLATENRLDIH